MTFSEHLHLKMTHVIYVNSLLHLMSKEIQKLKYNMIKCNVEMVKSARKLKILRQKFLQFHLKNVERNAQVHSNCIYVKMVKMIACFVQYSRKGQNALIYNVRRNIQFFNHGGRGG